MCVGLGCDGESTPLPGTDASGAAADWDGLERPQDAGSDEGFLDGMGPEADAVGAEADAGAPVVCPPSLPYASEVISFEPGVNAGFGQSEMPEVVLGPPTQGGASSGSLDVLSLGVGGEIVLGFGGRSLLDGAGPDFVIWENPFWIGGDPANPFAELGEVSVSGDGETWHTYPCDPDREEGIDDGCAGWRPRQDFDACELIPLMADIVGGDVFDLADLGLTEVRYVRIRDLATEGAEPTAGFDLDAVGGIHLAPEAELR